MNVCVHVFLYHCENLHTLQNFDQTMSYVAESATISIIHLVIKVILMPVLGNTLHITTLTLHKDYNSNRVMLKCWCQPSV